MENQLSEKTIFPIIKKLFRMISTMLAIEPVLINIIAIGMAMAVLVLLNHPTLFPKLGKYHLYFINSIYILILIQTIKSSVKSSFIPFLALIAAALGYAILSLNPNLQVINVEVLQKLMLLGVIGVATTIFSIN